MSGDGLHIMHDSELLADAIFKHDAAGRDNAKAVMRGLFDLLGAEGISVKVRRGKPVFEAKSSKP